VQSRAREQNPDTSSHDETRLHHLKLHDDRTAHAFWVLTFKTADSTTWVETGAEINNEDILKVNVTIY